MTNAACAKLKIDELFVHWLCTAETRAMIQTVVEDVKQGKPLVFNPSAQPPGSHTPFASPPAAGAAHGGPHGTSPRSPLSPAVGQLRVAQQVAAPRSPKARTGSPSSPRHISGEYKSPSASKLLQLIEDQRTPKPAASKEAIPQFYFPGGRPVPESVREQDRANVKAAFEAHGNAVTADELMPITKEIVELPCYFNKTLFAKLDANETGKVTLEAFEAFYESELQGKDMSTRAFNVLRKDANATGLTHEDFSPIVQEILTTHPGLEFLEATPEFQEKYAETVVIRIFYTVNRSDTGRITLRELKKSDLLEIMTTLEEEPDVNKVTRYFSYEHFYVLYCKFWELDNDHDHLIDKEDLLRYANYSLTYRIVDRIFDEAPRKLKCGVPGKMGYEDFCWFLLSEEDKNTPQATEYWFRCIDLDGNRELSRDELEYFYEEQLQRMECVSQETVAFPDVLCQMTDMINPVNEFVYTRADIKNCHSSGNLFNVLFNLNKFVAFEQRDPFMLRQEQLSGMTDWERFARAEYDLMAAEDEQGEEGGEENWDFNNPSEAPF